VRHAVLIVLCWGSAVFAAAPAEPSGSAVQGVPYEVRRGLVAELGVGAFFAVGGAQRISSAQPYLQIGLGYDIGRHVELGVQLGVGFSGGNCFGGLDVDGSCAFPDRFTVVFLDVTAAYLVRLTERLYLTPRIAGGYSALDPSPMPSAQNRASLSAPGHRIRHAQRPLLRRRRGCLSLHLQREHAHLRGDAADQVHVLGAASVPPSDCSGRRAGGAQGPPILAVGRYVLAAPMQQKG
jgi:hypothetical protein